MVAGVATAVTEAALVPGADAVAAGVGEGAGGGGVSRKQATTEAARAMEATTHAEPRAPGSPA